MPTRRLVYATRPYEYLQAALCAHAGFEAGRLERRVYPDGERGVRIADEPRGRDIVVIGGTFDDGASLELFDLATGLVAQGAGTLSMVVPYFGYSTQERAVRPGELVTAKARALLLSAVPRARLVNEILLIDLHTAGISYYFEGHLHSVHLSTQPLQLELVRTLTGGGPAGVVACTDAGRAKWVQILANAAGLPAAFVYKSRQSGSKTSVTGVNADVSGKHVLIYDDMVRTGGSLLEAAAAYKRAGAARLTAMTTHALLPGDSLAKIVGSGLLEALYCTDSLPQARALAAAHPGFLKVQSVTPLIAEYLS